MLPFLKKNKKKLFLRNLYSDKEKEVQTTKEQSNESTVLDDLQSVLDKIDNLRYFSLNSTDCKQSISYAFSRCNGKWYCTEDEYWHFKSHSIKEVIEYVEKGGEPKILPILIKR